MEGSDPGGRCDNLLSSGSSLALLELKKGQTMPSTCLAYRLQLPTVASWSSWHRASQSVRLGGGSRTEADATLNLWQGVDEGIAPSNVRLKGCRRPSAGCCSRL